MRARALHALLRDAQKGKQMRKLLIFAVLVLALPKPGAALDQDDWLSLVAMPLAVAAVAELTDIPTQDLVTFVTALNQAEVPPPQFVEVVRFVPVVLVDEAARPDFITFVNTQLSQGVRGDAMAVAIGERLRLVGVSEVNVASPQIFVVEQDILPAAVVTRVAAVRQHPHGGPPGQLKKVLGLKTGAEVVHGARPPQPVVGTRVDRDDDDDDDDRGRGVRGSDRKDNGEGKGKGNSGKGKKGKGDR